VEARIRVTHVLEATVGGTARHLAEVGCGLAAAGFAVETVISLCRDEDFTGKARRLAAAGAVVTEVPMAREIAPAADAGALLRLARHLRRSRPDVVHTHSSKAGILGRAAAVLAGVPAIVHSPHAFAFQMRVGPRRRALYLALERLAARRTDCLVAVSHAEAELAVAGRVLPAKRVAVIENGVDPESAAAPAEGRYVREELGIPAEAPVVLFVGRLCDQKAPEVLVDAAARVLSAHPEAVFLLAGDGPLREQVAGQAVRAGCEESVRTLGHRDDAPRLYAAASIFALPSRWEGLPYALLDAMNAGVPAIVSDIPPLREVVRDGETGLLAPTDDPVALAGALARLLAEPEAARALGAAGQAHVREHYALARQIDQLARLYRWLAGRGE